MKIPEDSRVWVGGGVAVAVVVSAVSWLFVFGPKLSDTSSLHDQANAARITNDQLTSEIVKLKAEEKKLPSYRASLRTVRNELPIEDALSPFTKTTNRYAKIARVTPKSMTVSTATPVNASGGAVDATSGTATAVAAGRLFAIPVTIVTVGSFNGQMQFMAQLQKLGSRAALITSTRLTPGDDTKDGSIDRHCSMTTNVTVFVAPQTAAQAQQLKKQLTGAS